ncbi:MAG: hypothetical protein ACREOZ_02845 [Gloeomargaritales cyanobacterium]
MFGQDVGKIFAQKYHGDITIVPHLDFMQMLGMKCLLNPTDHEMECFLHNGQRSTWPYIRYDYNYRLHLFIHCPRLAPPKQVRDFVVASAFAVLLGTP